MLKYISTKKQIQNRIKLMQQRKNPTALYKKVGCADWILSGRLSCYSGNIACDISYIIKNRTESS